MSYKVNCLILHTSYLILLNMDWSQQILRKRKLKATPTRIQVLDTIKAYSSAIPYSAIQNNLVDFDRVTLYRTINTLLDKGIIHKAYTTDDEVFYALCGDHCDSHDHHHDHIHFKCTSCNTVSCVNLPQNIAISLPSYQIEKLSINAVGVCAGCLG